MTSTSDPRQPFASTSSETSAVNPSTAIPTSSTPSNHTTTTSGQDAPRQQSSAPAASASELASTKISLLGALRSFPDFPIPGINFIDIMPLFQDPTIHASLLRALKLQVQEFGLSSDNTTVTKPDVIVGLDARGFLFGPSLALQFDASFVPVRKQGKLPGPCVTATYEKEYGADFFQMQEGAIKPGQKVLVVDDIIATGGSAAAAGSLVKQLGGDLMGYLFILEIPFLKGREKLGGLPTVTLLETDS
ncbi:adenine phosphoribosyltransferase [Phialemonium atrogriseum]|uniref:adenine phosphoribosyltransferase n=1 Tax=Phialemonium atrogriseum TaxID=1093897 RepID=A0AAJ0BZD1_9PEZI|nr:adenine phosphoribosyltransferase [Phialemonium atrogriseum]KAK1767041.1 adenine phosphoribosyltransferase [Phialemonium atrogriseum]